MKTLVLGGYGNFGARICRALAGDAALQLLVGGRDAQRAQALADSLGGNAAGVAIDFNAADFSARLRDLGAGLVIHTAGPFQQQSYGVAQAAAQANAHYIDLADGRRFVCDFPAALQAQFMAAGRAGISGASTVPALSSAVVDHLCAGWQSIASIDICIAPAQTAPIGEATMKAVLGYCGEPIRVWRNGQWQNERGWAAPQKVEFARMRPRLGALCDIPDLELFPQLYRVRERVMFRAALEVGLGQRSLALLAALRGAGLLPGLSRLAPLLLRATGALNFLGTALGGMVVRCTGQDAAARPAQRAWHIAADNSHGPEIPCMAAILLARKLARGEPVPLGASTAASLLTLAEFEPEFAKWGMVTDCMDENAPPDAQAAR